MIRCEDHIVAIYIGHFFYDLDEFLKGLLHGICRFSLGGRRVSRFVDHIVKNKNHLVIPHESTPFDFCIHLEKMLRLNGRALAIKSLLENLVSRRCASATSAVETHLTAGGINLPLRSGQQRGHAQLRVTG